MEKYLIKYNQRKSNNTYITIYCAQVFRNTNWFNFKKTTNIVCDKVSEISCEQILLHNLHEENILNEIKFIDWFVFPIETINFVFQNWIKIITYNFTILFNFELVALMYKTGLHKLMIYQLERKKNSGIIWRHGCVNYKIQRSGSNKCCY